MPGTVLGSADASVSKPVKDICPYRASILVEKLDKQQRTVSGGDREGKAGKRVR